ncbi:MAG: hypothetical protein A3C81_00885 [Candidatus Yanofskybacteria bacterium RIFCSPHIGHO2_02_FULL_46_19]|uniref:Uncharacterized protein n=2 Tax=Candidatus Yanofskyibacteriota TaxID=1752733 RepID=A0A1F8H2A6_9BACT|nr:MAG: hypothetical protein A3C81_00885 [Candidatus Yanofskybacteria bacterium RIFCSPHIGHO2_02_FULL_46_19]OGN31773.1 MAG: hypothetical protein A3J01_03205 [Candidatus Yanofskybacteria bacterium RIFCSPLOWO2_02_FULL_45_18]
MWILFPKIQNEDCAKKLNAENIQALRQWDISMILAIKLWWWIKSKLRLFAKRLNSTRKVISGWKISVSFWRNTT